MYPNLIRDMSSERFSQDVEREKEGLMQQAESVVRQKAAVDNEQKLLSTELNRIRSPLSDFEGHRTEKNSKMISALLESWLFRKSSRRLLKKDSRPSDKKYYEDKYKCEKAKVGAAKDTAKVLEVEFTVSIGPSFSTIRISIDHQFGSFVELD